jgi:hypothetical protein
VSDGWKRGCDGLRTPRDCTLRYRFRAEFSGEFTLLASIAIAFLRERRSHSIDDRAIP